MKQTSNYQFNLIESGDTFSPNPLNENMEKVEEALTDLDGQLSDRVSAIMTAMGSGGSTARIAFGSWVGDSSSACTLTFQFKPVLVVAVGSDGRFCTTMVRGARGSIYNNASVDVQWGDQSVTFKNSYTSDGYYVAIGV